jgi:hypothetical protein
LHEPLRQGCGSSLSDQKEREAAVNGINLMTKLTGYALTPVT